MPPTSVASVDRLLQPTSVWQVLARRGVLVSLLLWLATMLVFAAHGAWPVPDVNETHYLSKAKHYWNPAWCARDTFLNSADAHLVFYWTFGWLTRVFDLPIVAWLGRWLTWGLLAWAWQTLFERSAARREWGPLAAALYVLLTERLHLAGEWVIGGIEAKGFAFVFVWWAYAELVAGQSRWPRAIVLFALATLFHPLVGGWAALAAFAAIGHLHWHGQRSLAGAGKLFGDCCPRYVWPHSSSRRSPGKAGNYRAECRTKSRSRHIASRLKSACRIISTQPSFSRIPLCGMSRCNLLRSRPVGGGCAHGESDFHEISNPSANS